jgi:hypothetical protein
MRIVIYAALGLFACSSGSGGGVGGTGSSVDLTQFCEQLAAREQSCGDQPETTEQCKEDWAPLVAYLRSDMWPQLHQCLVERDCQTSDDSCYASVGQNAPPSKLRDTWESKCLAKVAECNGELSDDLCTDGDVPWRLFSDATYEKFTPCFDQDTCDLEACFAG